MSVQDQHMRSLKKKGEKLVEFSTQGEATNMDFSDQQDRNGLTKYLAAHHESSSKEKDLRGPK